MYRLSASLYSVQCSPIAIFKLVYNGSRSTLCAALFVLEAFCTAGILLPFARDVRGGGKRGCAKLSLRLRAAGSMSGILGWETFPEMPMRLRVVGGASNVVGDLR